MVSFVSLPTFRYVLYKCGFISWFFRSVSFGATHSSYKPWGPFTKYWLIFKGIYENDEKLSLRATIIFHEKFNFTESQLTIWFWNICSTWIKFVIFQTCLVKVPAGGLSVLVIITVWFGKRFFFTPYVILSLSLSK